MNPLVVVRAAHGLLALGRPRQLASWYGAPAPSAAKDEGGTGRGSVRAAGSADELAARRHTVVTRALRILGMRQLLEVLAIRVFRGSPVHAAAQAGDVLHAASMFLVARRWPWLRRPALTSAAVAVAYVTAARLHDRRRPTHPRSTGTGPGELPGGSVQAPGEHGRDDLRATGASRSVEGIPLYTPAPPPPVSPPSRPLPGRSRDDLESTRARLVPSPGTPASPGVSSRSARPATVRPRIIWAGVAVAVIGMLTVGLGMVTSVPWLWVAGLGVLLAGAVVSLVGGILHDTHSSQAGRRELQAVAAGTTRDGASPDVTRHSPEAARVAAGTRELLRDRERSPLLLRFPAAVALVLLGVWLQVGQWVLVYPFDAVGQDTALRDTGFAIVVTLAGLRLCSTRSLRAGVVAALSGLLLVLAGALEPHAAARGSVNELVTGALVVLAASGAAVRDPSHDPVTSQAAG